MMSAPTEQDNFTLSMSDNYATGAIRNGSSELNTNQGEKLILYHVKV